MKDINRALVNKSIAIWGSTPEYRRTKIAESVRHFKAKGWMTFVLPEGRYDHDVVRQAFPIRPLAKGQTSKEQMTSGQIWDAFLVWAREPTGILIVLSEVDWVLQPPEGKKAAARFKKTLPLAAMVRPYLSEAAEKKLHEKGLLRILVTMQQQPDLALFGDGVWANAPAIRDKFNPHGMSESVSFNVSDLLEIISASPNEKKAA